MKTNSSIQIGLRISGGVVLGLIGWSLADLFPYENLLSPLDNRFFSHVLLLIVFGLIGAIMLPTLAGRSLMVMYERISKISAVQIIANFIGMVGGLLLAALLAFPLARLPEPFGPVLPFLAAIAFASLGLGVMGLRYREIFRILNIRLPESKPEELSPHPHKEPMLLDTSVIIDGRIADIAGAGFIRGDMIVPRFVLNELQYVADSTESLRRVRGRRGLEVLRRLQREQENRVKIVDDDPGESPRVDEKLVMLAKRWQCPIVTNDYNLNKVASLQGVPVMNINELANAVKSVLIPGEMLDIEIIQEGKEAGQGVGYLDDGTMVVVEEGRSYLNHTIPVTVTKVLQTAAGRLIFAKL
ncbi:MAG: PIN domain nuclease [Chloroflexi bacterium]|nr:PIN domain nuclease [Chloroflexota bacterium]